MKNALLRALAGSLLMAFSTAWAASPPVAADTYTSTANSAQNFGGQAALLVSSGNTSWVRFDLSSYSSLTGADVVHAYIAGYVKTVTTGGTVNICDANGSWTESGLSSNNAPSPNCGLGYTYSATERYSNLIRIPSPNRCSPVRNSVSAAN